MSDSLQQIIIEGVQSGDYTPTQIRANVEIALERVEQHAADAEPTRYYEPPEDRAGTVFDPTDETFGPIMAAIQAGKFEEAADLLTSPMHVQTHTRPERGIE